MELNTKINQAIQGRDPILRLCYSTRGERDRT